VGDGFPVRNLFPVERLKSELNPFLMLDYAGPSRFEPSKKPRGVGEYPDGDSKPSPLPIGARHRDSAGNQGVIYPGDVQ